MKIPENYNRKAPLPALVLFVLAVLGLTLISSWHEVWAQPVVSSPSPIVLRSPIVLPSPIILRTPIVIVSPIPLMSRPEWQKYMSTHALPGIGCFTANYPSTTWAATQCVLAPPYPLNVGNSADFVAQAPSGNIFSATGSFPNVSPALTGTTENDVGNPFTFGGTNDFSLQVNTNTFQTNTSNGVLQNGNNPCASGSGCTGWQQFVLTNYASFSPVGSNLYMQFWLLGYQAANGSCPNSQIPGGWESGLLGQWRTSNGSCFINSPAASVPIQNISDLSGMVLTGIVNLLGADEALLFTPDGASAIPLPTGFLGLTNQSWREAEFNVFGLWNSSEAVFNSGNVVTVSNTLTGPGGATIAASCLPHSSPFDGQSGSGTTGETNNLTLDPCPCFSNGPGIVFTESDLTPTFCTCPNGQTWDQFTNACICAPNCYSSGGVMCGGQPNGCGGTCQALTSCGAYPPCKNGFCCTPKCAGAKCGAPDGCGGTCVGWCSPQLSCDGSAGKYSCGQPRFEK